MGLMSQIGIISPIGAMGMGAPSPRFLIGRLAAIWSFDVICTPYFLHTCTYSVQKYTHFCLKNLQT